MSELVTAERSADEALAPSSLLRDAWRDLRRNPVFIGAGAVVVVMLLMAAVPPLFAGWFGHGDPYACNLRNSAMPPAAGHPFGFDKQGCDLYANVIYGARASISVGLLVSATSLALALVLGTLAGYYGRWVDTVVSRVTDVFFGFPFILGALVILAVVPVRNVVTVSFIVALFNWPPLVRLMRSTVISIKDTEYVVAARAMGASDWRLATRHIIPNAFQPVLVLVSLNVGSIIVAEAALTFLGVGLRPPAISWGLELSTAQSYFQTAPHLLLFPSLFLSLTVLAFIMLGDAIRDAFDPRLR
jgi:oligopeptide transport system permease protein